MWCGHARVEVGGGRCGVVGKRRHLCSRFALSK